MLSSGPPEACRIAKASFPAGWLAASYSGMTDGRSPAWAGSDDTIDTPEVLPWPFSAFYTTRRRTWLDGPMGGPTWLSH
jgi:hypothetical protein